jgi:DNA polymerase elongation subunit (family B)
MTTYAELNDDELIEKYKSVSNIVSSNRNAEQAIKILLNAGYGAFTNSHFKFFDIRIGTSITLTGQCIIQWCEKTFNNYFNKILKTQDVDFVHYVDTDSNYIDFQPLVDLYCSNKTDDQILDFIDVICQTKMKSLLDKSFTEFGNYTNAFESTINFKRENICSSGIWVGKKKYLLRVHDSEGVRYSKPEIKVTGLEIVRSSTPEMVRKGLTDCVEYMLNDDVIGLRKFTSQLKKTFCESNPDIIAFPRGVNDVEKWMVGGPKYKSGCPIAVRSAILYNYYIMDKKITNRYAKINSGDKIKFVYLVKRNPIQENVIGFNAEFPIEIVDRKYIDYNLQWNKAFVAPLTSLLDSIGLELEPKKKLDEWFCD